jgi:YidC/Oxa1 family membrane protein insertase
MLPGNDLGLAILILTLILRTILLIPSQKAMRSQKKLQEVNPRIEKLKEKYKGDQQKIAAETMAIWKESKVNPLSSCMPILLQLPILIAVYQTVRNGLNPDNTYMLYTTYSNFSLKDINVNFLGILDLTKVNVYVLPLIIGGLQFAQMKLSMAKTKKKTADNAPKNEMAMANNMMIYMMPVMIALFTASVPAGVALYWGISTLFGIGQQLVVNKEKPKENDDVKVRVIEN